MKTAAVGPGQFHTKIVGIGQVNPDGTKRQRWAKRLKAGQRLELRREPQNPFDRNAIAVYGRFGLFRRRRQLGYLSADLAWQYAGYLDSGGKIGVAVSEVTGGGGMLWWKRSYGVNLLITVG